MRPFVANRHNDKVAGAACLDFINTVSWPSLDDDELQTFDDAVAWGVSAGILKRGEKVHGPGESRELGALKRLRLLLREVFMGNTRKLDVFNRELRRVGRSVRVTPSGQWAVGSGVTALRDRLLWDAASLLTSPRITILKTCANPDCGWLFIDASRRGNRRWCRMTDCGNREKARRFYAKKVSDTSAGKRRQRRPRRRPGRP
jgi:predicted RNA-binding Zn ribbon-like protein